MKKTYLIKYSIVDGEHEYEQLAFVEGSTIAHIEKKAEKIFRKGAYRGDYREYKLGTIEEIREEKAIRILSIYAGVYKL